MKWEESEVKELLALQQSQPALFRDGECCWKARRHVDVDTVVKREDLNRECQRTVSNHTQAWQYADSCCSLCKVKAKAEAVGRGTFDTALRRNLWV